MDILSIFGTFFSSIISGGVTGILGVAVQRFFDIKNKRIDLEATKQKNDHEVAMLKTQSEIMAQEWAARTEIASIEFAGREAAFDAQAFAASFKEPELASKQVQTTVGQGWALVILDFIRGVVRPLLTVYLCVLTTLIYLQAHRVIEASGINEENALEIIRLVIGTILYLTTTCLLWWFGVRNRQKAPLGWK